MLRGWVGFILAVLVSFPCFAEISDGNKSRGQSETERNSVYSDAIFLGGRAGFQSMPDTLIAAGYKNEDAVPVGVDFLYLFNLGRTGFFVGPTAGYSTWDWELEDYDLSVKNTGVSLGIAGGYLTGEGGKYRNILVVKVEGENVSGDMGGDVCDSAGARQICNSADLDSTAAAISIGGYSFPNNGFGMSTGLVLKKYLSADTYDEIFGLHLSIGVSF